MRIYRRKEFLALPAGTVYARGKQWHFDGLNVKDDSLANDWLYTDPMWIEAHDDGEQWARLVAMLEEGASYPLDDAVQRDGRFDSEDLFLVAERADLEKLKEMIEAALAVSK